MFDRSILKKLIQYTTIKRFNKKWNVKETKGLYKNMKGCIFNRKYLQWRIQLLLPYTTIPQKYNISKFIHTHFSKKTWISGEGVQSKAKKALTL